MIPRNPEEARQAIEARLGEPLTDREMLLLEEESRIAEILDPDFSQAAIQESADYIRRWRAARPVGPRANGGRAPYFIRSDRAQQRQEAAALILAMDAERETVVQSFRQDALPDGLLPFEAIGDWVRARAREGSPDEEHEPVRYGAFAYDPPSLRYVDRVGDSGRLFERSIPTRGGVLLERLRLLSEALGEKYGWPTASATVFILTGEIPARPPVRGHYSDIYVTHRLAGRITLEIDPTTSAAEVAEEYRRYQRDLLGPRQFRSQSEKHINLAVFLHRHQPRPTWAALMQLWNSEYPAWIYEDWRRFQRDCKGAHERLLSPIQPRFMPMEEDMASNLESLNEHDSERRGYGEA